MIKLTYEDLLTQRLSPKDALETVRKPVIGILENIRSLYNVGSCFRTADSMLLKKLILTGYTPSPPLKEISKTALGADLSVPYEYYNNICEAIIKLKSEGFKVYALEQTDSSIDISKIDSVKDSNKIEYPLAFIAGNEISGVSEEALKLCNSASEIPMLGVKHSLNVAVAFGIAAYQLTIRC